jgi:CheY-like chemotaxis protein
LLVEDEKATRDVITAVLKMAGAEVVAVDTAAAALDAYSGQRPDVILSDVGLPGMDGHELIRRIRELESGDKQPPVLAIALTAYTRDVDQQKSTRSGFQSHLAKPIAPQALLNELAKLLGKGSELQK